MDLDTVDLYSAIIAIPVISAWTTLAFVALRSISKLHHNKDEKRYNEKVKKFLNHHIP